MLPIHWEFLERFRRANWFLPQSCWTQKLRGAGQVAFVR